MDRKVSSHKTASLRRRPDRLAFEDLRSSDYDVIEFFRSHQALGRACPFDNQATVTLAETLPLGRRGVGHKQLRLEMAKALAKGRMRLEAALPRLVQTHFSPLQTAGVYDGLGDICVPFVNACMDHLTGLDLDVDHYDQLSDIFDPAASIPRRKRLELTARNLLGHLQHGGDAGADENAIRVAVAVMGRDPLLSAVVLSLHRHMQAVKGRAINAQPFDPVPTDTAVNYVWREKVTGENAGLVYECDLGQFTGQDPKTRMNYFGLGPHTCLGKAHSLLIFQALSTHLTSFQRVVDWSFVSTRAHHVMKIPSRFEFEIK